MDPYAPAEGHITLHWDMLEPATRLKVWEWIEAAKKTPTNMPVVKLELELFISEANWTQTMDRSRLDLEFTARKVEWPEKDRPESEIRSGRAHAREGERGLNGN